MSNLTVDQSTHSRHALDVTTAMVVVSLPQTVIAAHTQDGVFYYYAALSKGCVVR